jgi:hypothetical protein
MKHATIFDNSKTYMCGRINYAQSNSVDERIARTKPTFPAYAIKKHLNDRDVCQQCKNKAIKDFGLA